jgi:Zn-dependent peptidase ImmA (M78 family)
VVRNALELSPDEPIVDVCRLLESAGVKVYALPLEHDRFFGLSVAAEDGGPAVVVNTDESVTVERQIFTAAHEFGHLLLHPGAYDVDKLEEDDAEEREADAFAGHLLMPEEAFRTEWGGTYGLETYVRVLHVKRIFRVSYAAVLHRLVEDGLADRSVYGWFRAEHKRRTGKTLGKRDEPVALAPSDFAEDLLSTMVRRALEGDLISHSRGAEALGLSAGEMRQLVSSWDYAR